jgi:hypothetical protein
LRNELSWDDSKGLSINYDEQFKTKYKV